MDGKRTGRVFRIFVDVLGQQVSLGHRGGETSLSARQLTKGATICSLQHVSCFLSALPFISYNIETHIENCFNNLGLLFDSSLSPENAVVMKFFLFRVFCVVENRPPVLFLSEQKITVTFCLFYLYLKSKKFPNLGEVDLSKIESQPCDLIFGEV